MPLPLLLLLLPACSLSTYDYTPCTEDSQCRAAFGNGMICSDAGLCAPLPPLDRCATAWPEDFFSAPDLHRDDIVLATLFSRDPIEGDLEEALAAELAVRQVNDQGGLDGHPYAVVHCDYTEDPGIDALTATEAVQAAGQYLVDLGVPALVGPATSSMSQDVWPVMEAGNLLYISPSATSPALTDIDGLIKTDAEPGLFWRTAPPDDLQGLAIAQDMADRDVVTVAVIHETSNYGSALADVFKSYFEASGSGQVTLYPFDEGDGTGRDTQVATSGGEPFDEVLFISGNIDDYIAFLNAAASLSSYDDRAIFLTDAGRDTKLLENTPGARDLYDQIRGSAPAVPTGTLYDFFQSAFAAAYAPGYSASDSSYTSYAYDAGWLAIYGTAWSLYNEADACSDDDHICGLGAARGMRRISDGATVEIMATTWNTVQASFQVGQSINVSGASGDLNFNPETGETVGPVDIWQINSTSDGFNTVTTISP